jgi:hypothetical protein
VGGGLFSKTPAWGEEGGKAARPTVVASVPPFPLQLERRDGRVQVVVHHQHLGLGNLVVRQDGVNRLAAEVHERLGLGEDHGGARDLPSAELRPRAGLALFTTLLLRVKTPVDDSQYGRCNQSDTPTLPYPHAPRGGSVERDALGGGQALHHLDVASTS